MHNKLIHWSKSQFHYLPWRTDRSIYRTLVSEIMLQQTTVSTVLNHFEHFLKKFPDIKSLARASEDEVLIAWKGLGYYRRAKNLKKIAEQIQKKHRGEIPSTFEELIQLNGVGPYTASALISIGHDQKAIAIDANLERVLSRLYAIKDMKGPRLTAQLYQLFNDKKILHEEKINSYRELNEALMDLGRVNCRAKMTDCLSCPLNKICLAHKNKKELSYPVQSKQIKDQHELHLLRIVVKKKDKILTYQKMAGEWLDGQWEVPTFIISSTDKNLKQYPKYSQNNLNFAQLPKYKTSITKYSITNSILELDEVSFKKMKLGKGFCWKENSSDSNFTTATIKCLKKVLSN